MIARIVYPLPFDAWSVFEQEVYRFAHTFKTYPPECDYVLYLVTQWGLPTPSIYELFYNTRHVWTPPFNTNGADLGAHRFVADMLPENEFLIGLSARCYFHRPGWGRRLLEAREKYGPGIYGTGSMEHLPHIRTCGYGIDVFYWKNHPVSPTDRPTTVEIESGQHCLTTHVLNEAGKAMQVTWDNERELADCRNPEELGIFRRGSQNAMLVWDRHTELFAAASDEEKARLSGLSDHG
jgi:hypothetical protein